MPWKVAAKIWLCVVLAASYFSAKHMVRTCNTPASIWLVVPTTVFLNVNLWFGFVNFQLGICWAILIASLLLRGERREWIYGFLLVVAFFVHMIPFAFAALLILLYAIQSGRMGLLWQFLPSASLSVWYLIGRYVVEHDADGKAGMIDIVPRVLSLTFCAYKVDSWLKSFGFINPANADKSVALQMLGAAPFLSLFFVNAILAVAMGWILVRSAVSAYREQRRERFIWTAALLFGGVYLIAPGTALGIANPGWRLLQTALAVVTFLVVINQRCDRRFLRVAATCSILLAVSNLYLFERVTYSTLQRGSAAGYLPQKMLLFSHINPHTRECYYEAIDRGDMSLSVWPTAMFLNTAVAKNIPPDCVVGRETK